jgi:wyosine [tRNA(Phe)-imidazoG37] synthetase (radical SAM superfamily)
MSYSPREADEQKRIDLQKSFIYGPVSSRRLGKSLGINPILPGRKACSFNCLYCQYEAVRPVRSLYEVDPALFGDPGVIEKELRERLVALAAEGATASYLTFAGNGEPTLHPRFPALVEKVLAARRELLPGARTAILTNGTVLVLPEVRKAVGRLDTVIVKLDAGSEEGIRRVNRPYRGFDFDAFLEAARGLPHLVVQTLFFEGSRTNAGENDVAAWIRAVNFLRPERVQIYSLDRAPAEKGVLPLLPRRLEEIARRLLEETGVRADVF